MIYYVAQREIFYLKQYEFITEIAREKTIDGNSVVRTTERGLNNVQFPIPTAVLLNEAYFKTNSEEEYFGRFPEGADIL